MLGLEESQLMQTMLLRVILVRRSTVTPHGMHGRIVKRVSGAVLGIEKRSASSAGGGGDPTCS